MKSNMDEGLQLGAAFSLVNGGYVCLQFTIGLVVDLYLWSLSFIEQKCSVLDSSPCGIKTDKRKHIWPSLYPRYRERWVKLNVSGEIM